MLLPKMREKKNLSSMIEQIKVAAKEMLYGSNKFDAPKICL